MTAAVEIGRLPAPDVVERVDYDVILGQQVSAFRSRDPDYSAVVESDPAVKLLEVSSYREALVRQRVNDGARSVMLAYAEDADLDNLVAILGVARAAGETDATLRRRAVLSLEKLTTAGSRDSYVARALDVDPAKVIDATATSPSAGNVTVTVLGGDHPDGALGASDALTVAVRTALGSDAVRPLTDVLTVAGAQVRPYVVTAALTLLPGPDAEVVRAASEAAVTAYCRSLHRIGATVPLSGLYAALHVEGVEKVAMSAPAADVAAAAGQAPWPTTGSAAVYAAPAHHPLNGVTVTVA